MEEIKIKCLNILKELDRVCNCANLRYYIYAGTLLGAVRHKGFIPWDDDIDVVMFRDDYEKLTNACSQYLNHDKYELQSIYSDSKACNAWMKLHDKNTAYISGNRRKGAMEGINIDIFPIDNAPDNDIVLKIRAFVIDHITELYRLRYLKHSKNASKKMQLYQKLIMFIPPWNEQKFKIRYDKYIRKYNNRKTNRVVYFSNRKYAKKVVPKKCFETIEMLQFEDGVFPAPGGWKIILETCYGTNYMTPPPKDEQHSWHDAKIIDLNHSWREYISEQ